MAKLMRTLYKAALIFPAILVFVAHGFVIRTLTRDRRRRLARLEYHASRYATFALRIMNIRIHVKKPREVTHENALIVGNHLSYLDMMILSSVQPTVFVTSVDMGQVPGLGAICEMTGAIFIERRNRERVAHDLDQISKVLREGFDVAIFPEGTSGDGTAVLPFKKSLLMAAGLASKPIQPLTLKYTAVSGERFSLKNRDSVCWYGDMDFVSHILRVMGQTSMDVEVLYHQPFRLDAASTRDSVALRCYEPVSRAYGFPFA